MQRLPGGRDALHCFFLLAVHFILKYKDVSRLCVSGSCLFKNKTRSFFSKFVCQKFIKWDPWVTSPSSLIRNRFTSAIANFFSKNVNPKSKMFDWDSWKAELKLTLYVLVLLQNSGEEKGRRGKCADICPLEFRHNRWLTDDYWLTDVKLGVSQYCRICSWLNSTTYMTFWLLKDWCCHYHQTKFSFLLLGGTCTSTSSPFLSKETVKRKQNLYFQEALNGRMLNTQWKKTLSMS